MRPGQCREIWRDRVDDVQCGEPQLIVVRREYRLGALEDFANVVRVADASQPLDRVDDQDDFAIGIAALAPYILHCLDCEVAPLLYQLFDQAARLDLQIVP